MFFARGVGGSSARKAMTAVISLSAPGQIAKLRPQYGEIVISQLKFPLFRRISPIVVVPRVSRKILTILWAFLVVSSAAINADLKDGALSVLCRLLFGLNLCWVESNQFSHGGPTTRGEEALEDVRIEAGEIE